MERDLKKIVSQMTWKKKQACAPALISAPETVDRLGIPEVMVSCRPSRTSQAG